MSEDGEILPFNPIQEAAYDADTRIVTVAAGPQGGKCFSSQTRILLASGERKVIRDVEIGDVVFSLGDDLKIHSYVVTDSFCTGIKPTFKVTTKLGRSVIVTEEHPLYTESGWRSLRELGVGDWIGVPRSLPDVGANEYDVRLMRLMGYLIGDGGLSNSTVRFTNADEEVVSDIAACLPAGASFRKTRKYEYTITGKKTEASALRSPVMRLVRDWKIDCLSKHKRIPEFVFELRREYIAPMLNALFACDGWIDNKGFGYCSASEGLVDDVMHLLLRFGIISRKHYKKSKCNGKYFDAWSISVFDYDDLVTLSREIGIISKQKKLDALIGKKSILRSNYKDYAVDFDRDACWSMLPEPKPSHSKVRYPRRSGSVGYELLRVNRKKTVSRWGAQRLAAHFGIGMNEAHSDIFWDTIASIEPLGEDVVFDITVAGSHNFIADDIFAHNSLGGPPWMWREVQRCGRGDYLVVSNDFDMFKLKLLPVYVQYFVNTLDVARYWNANRILEIRDPKSGQFLADRSQDNMWARIILRSADDKGGMESATAKAVHMDEAGLGNYDLPLWRAIKRRSAIHKARVLLTTTLYETQGWLNNVIINPCELGGTQTLISYDNGAEMIITRNEYTDITLIQADSTLNPRFDLSEFEEARKSMPDDEFEMMYRGRVTIPRDMIYDCFDFKKHTCARFYPPDTWQRVWGLDFGGANTAVVKLARNPENGIYYCYSEYKSGGKSAIEHVSDLMRGEPRGNVICFGGAKAEEQWRNEFAAAGLPVIRPPIDDVWLGVQRVYSVLKQGELIFFNDLPGVLKQIRIYRRKRDRATGEGLMEIDKKQTAHFLDGLRYAIAGQSEISSPSSWLDAEMKQLGLTQERSMPVPIPSDLELYERLRTGRPIVDTIGNQAYNLFGMM